MIGGQRQPHPDPGSGLLGALLGVDLAVVAAPVLSPATFPFPRQPLLLPTRPTAHHRPPSRHATTVSPRLT
jgi:hypothetical protein